MANYTIFFSPSGGTKKVADFLVRNLHGDYSEIDLCRDLAPVSFCTDDICLVSVPSYGGRVPTIAIERLKRMTSNGARAILNCVYGNREWDDTLTELQDTLESCGFLCVAAVAAVAEHSIFRQFAAGRPDAEDEPQLAEFAKQIQAILDKPSCGQLTLSGSHGNYKEYGGVPFTPEANDKCGSCGICADLCPTGAISVADPGKTDAEKCISCMRCVAVCPQHARDFDAAMMAERAEKMAPVLSGYKENHLFLSEQIKY